MTSHKINIGKAVYSVKQHENGTFTAYNCSTLREVKSENTVRKILKALAERDHEEALEMHYARETAAVNASRVQSQFRAASAERQARWLHEAHAQALVMNDGIEKAKVIMAAMMDSESAAAATSGVLIRTGYEEVDFIIHTALMGRAVILKAHAEALEMDDELNHSKSQAEMEESAISINPPDLAQRALSFRLNYTPEGRERRIREAHSEALEINAAIDSMIAARQHIANKKTDFSQETWDLVRLGNSYKEAGREWYRWAKATALRLWENRLTQRQLFQLQ